MALTKNIEELTSIIYMAGRRSACATRSFTGNSYTGQPFADSVKERLNATVQVGKRNELHTFAVLPKRCVVERSFGWLEKRRRLWKNCERKLNTSLQFVHLAFLVLLLKRS